MFCGLPIVYGDPGALLTLVGVTVNTNNLLAAFAIPYRWLSLSQNIWSTSIVVSSLVYFVIWLPPLKWKICKPPVPATARRVPAGEGERLVTLWPPVEGMFWYVLWVVRLPELSAV